MKRYMAVSIAISAALCLTSTTSLAGPSANRTKEGSGLLHALIFGDSDHPNQPSQGSTSEPNTMPRLSQPDPVPSKQVASQRPPINYDGIWTDHHGMTLLIKQIHRTLYLSGSSNVAAWQAQCVSSAQSARCIGTGISKTAGEFRYASELQRGAAGLSKPLESTKIQSNWRRDYSNGDSRSGLASLTPAH